MNKLRIDSSFKVLSILLLLSFAIINNAWSHGVSMKASAFIISPQDGTDVSSPFLVKFGIKHFLIAPAGENIHKAGHYHLLIDQVGKSSMDEAIPYDQHHLHFDQGETEALLTLPPGKHTLQLIVGDEEHEPFEELISTPINVNILSPKI